MTNEQQERLEWLRVRRGSAAQMTAERGWMHAESPTWTDIDFLLSLLDSDSQAAEDNLVSRDEALAFFGASLKEDGGLSINMKKYHAAHLCQEHAFQPWRRTEIEETCVMCLARDRTLAATSMRDKCVGAIKLLWTTDRSNDYNGALNDALREIESLTLDQVEPKQP